MKGKQMNIVKRSIFRSLQAAEKILVRILPYRHPEILHNENEVANVLSDHGISSVLIVTGPRVSGIGLTNDTVRILSEHGIKVTVYDKVQPDPSIENVKDAYRAYADNGCQALIGFGGGSPLDCAKAVGVMAVRPNIDLRKCGGIMRIRKKIPLLIAVPTTAGTGSETTFAMVISDSESKKKIAAGDFVLIPHYAMMRPELTVSLPPSVTANSGMDALSHAVEAYVGRLLTKESKECSLQAVKLIFENLERCYTRPDDLTARGNMLMAANLAGRALTISSVGNIHAIAHRLGGRYDIPHGLAIAVVMPYVLRDYGRTIHRRLWEMGIYSGLFDESTSYENGAEQFIRAIEDMNSRMEIPNSFEEIREEDIHGMAVEAEKEANPLYPVPLMFTVKEMEDSFRAMMPERGQ